MSKEIMSFKKIGVAVDQLIRAEDYKLFFKNGNFLIDTMSGLWCVPLGYSNKEIKLSMFEQCENLPYGTNFLGYQNQITEQYAELLCKLTNMHKVYFTNSGSSAVETAIKLTLKKKGIVSKYSYHGSTILSACASDQNINSSWNVNSPIDVLKFDNPDNLEKLLKENNDAFVMIEPVIAAGGVYPHVDQVFKILKYYQKNNLVIFDETVTGFGKLGRMFAFEKFNFKPDIIVLGKAITNGYFPLGACLATEKVLENIKFFNHGFTFSGHPIGTAVALKTLQILMRSQDLFLNHDRFYKDDNISRQIGCMGAIDFVSPKKSLSFLRKMRQRGYILEYGSENINTIVYCLPYIFSNEDYKNFLKNISECKKELVI